MSELDTLTDEFERLLKGIRSEYSLEEWRYAYRKIINAGAMKILQKFPEIIVGPPPGPAPQQQQQQQGPGRGDYPTGGGGPLHPVVDGQRPPWYPSGIGKLVCIVLGNCPPQQT